MTRHPEITFNLPDGRELEFELEISKVTIGRAPDNLIVLDDEAVSSHHAVLEVRDGFLELSDLGSNNGLRFRGKKVARCELKDGDEVQIGATVMRCRVPVAEASVVPSPVASRMNPPPPGVEPEEGLVVEEINTSCFDIFADFKGGLQMLAGKYELRVRDLSLGDDSPCLDLVEQQGLGGSLVRLDIRSNGPGRCVVDVRRCSQEAKADKVFREVLDLVGRTKQRFASAPAAAAKPPAAVEGLHELFAAAVAANQAQDFEKANGFYRQILERDTNNARAMSMLGLSAVLDRGDIVEAATWFSRAARCGAERGMVYQYLVEIHEASGTPMPASYRDMANDGRTVLGPEMKKKVADLVEEASVVRLTKVLVGDGALTPEGGAISKSTETAIKSEGGAAEFNKARVSTDTPPVRESTAAPPGRVEIERTSRAVDHNNDGALNTLNAKIQEWLAHGQVGASSKAMAAAAGCLGEDARSSAYPLDPDDLNRCLLLLEAVPEIRERFDAIATISPTWARLIAKWDQLESSFLKEAGRNWSKGNTGAPKTFAMICEILGPDSVFRGSVMAQDGAGGDGGQFAMEVPERKGEEVATPVSMEDALNSIREARDSIRASLDLKTLCGMPKPFYQVTDLGNPISVHKTDWVHIATLSLLLLFLAVIPDLFVGAILAQCGLPTGVAIVMAILIVVIPIGFLALVKMRKAAVVYKEGLALSDRKGVRTWRWDELEGLTAPLGSGTHFWCWLYLKGGAKLKLSNSYSRVQRLAELIRIYSEPRIASAVSAAWVERKDCRFGAVTANSLNGIKVDGVWIGWDDLQWQAQAGSLKVQKKGKMLSKLLHISKVPNLNLLIVLMAQVSSNSRNK